MNDDFERLDLPESFCNTIRSCFRAEGEAWLNRLGELIRFYEAQWSLRVGEPFELSYSYCAPAQTLDGREVALKLEFPNDEARHRIQALRHYNGRGMVRLLRADEAQGASLMERLRPGQTLAEAVQDDDEATRIAAEVMQAMWIPAPTDYPYPTLDDWRRQFHQFFAEQRVGNGQLPRRIIERTGALFADLLASAGEPVLLHGDLHHFNILSVLEADQLGWRAIDPFGVIGERELDVGAFMRNPNLSLPLDASLRKKLLRRLDIFHEVLGFDRQRMIAWTAVYAAVSASWTMMDGMDGWQFDAALAEQFGELLKFNLNFSKFGL